MGRPESKLLATVLDRVASMRTDNTGMRVRNYATADEAAEFYRAALMNRAIEGKLPLGKLTNLDAINAVLDRAVLLDEVVVQASYLLHIHDYHGPGGIRQDTHPVTWADIALALRVINSDPAPVNIGKTSHAGNPLIRFEQRIGGVIYKVIGEIRPGKRNRNVAVFNLYKR